MLGFPSPTASLLGSEEALAVALSTNRICYSTVAATYRLSGAKRAAEANRWLARFWSAVDPTATKLLEVGSADGVLTHALTLRGFDVTAVEFSPVMAAATRAAAPTALVLESEFLSSPLPEHQFDVVLANAMVHLFPPPYDEAVVRRVASLLKPRGRAFVSTTVEDRYSSGFEIKAESSAVTRFRTRYRQQDMEALLSRGGLTTVDFYMERDRLAPEKTWGNWIVESRGEFK